MPIILIYGSEVGTGGISYISGKKLASLKFSNHGIHQFSLQIALSYECSTNFSISVPLDIWLSVAWKQFAYCILKNFFLVKKGKNQYFFICSQK